MPKKLAAVPAHDYFRATGAELREWAATGDTAAEAEIARRKAKRAEKVAAKVAA